MQCTCQCTTLRSRWPSLCPLMPCEAERGGHLRWRHPGKHSHLIGTTIECLATKVTALRGSLSSTDNRYAVCQRSIRIRIRIRAPTTYTYREQRVRLLVTVTRSGVTVPTRTRNRKSNSNRLSLSSVHVHKPCHYCLISLPLLHRPRPLSHRHSTAGQSPPSPTGAGLLH